MCARYGINRKLYDEIEDLVGVLPDGVEMRTGDMRPSEKVPVIVAENGVLVCREMVWGYPSFNGKGLLINARAETASEKKTFRCGMRYGRCLIPASLFYEWDKDKNKVSFQLPEHRAMFLAGCSDCFGGIERFAIITVDANDSVAPVHERMPLLISFEDAKDWLLSESYAEMLKAPMPELEVGRNYEQLSLF